MKQLTKILSLFLLSLVLILGLLPEAASAEVTGKKKSVSGSVLSAASPSVIAVLPQNQTQTDALIVDLYTTPFSTASSSTAGYFIDAYVTKQNALRNSFTSTANQYKHAFLQSGKDKALQRMMKAENAASAAKFKAFGAKLGSNVYSSYCLYKYIKEYNDVSKHKHSSLAFLDQTLRGFSITAGALDLGGLKLAKPLAIGSGILSDVVGGNTFSNWANQQDNIVLEYTDYVADYVNDSTYEAFLFYMKLFDNTSNANTYGRPPYGTGVYKPNIYLYPTKETMIKVSFDLPALLATTIPLYEQQWQVIASTDGSLIDKESGITYEFLFYESQTDPALFTYGSGWVLCADTRELQFRKILTKYGFNEKESADFIDFWMKKLTSGVDYIMYPQLSEAVDSAMPITVSPRPDNSFRLWFAFKAFSGKTPDVPVITAMNREGYALVEWGGYILD